MKYLFLALILAGCGGGGGGFTAAPVTQGATAPNVVKGAKLVTAYGDSTQRGTPDLNPALVAASFTDATIHQEGVGGSSAWHLWAGTEYQLPVPVHKEPFTQLSLDSPANVMTFRFGINDTQTTSPGDFANILTALVVTAQSGGARRVILETPNPVWIEPHRSLQPALVQAIRDVAAQHKAVLCDHYRLAFEQGIEHETSDGVHPSEAAVVFQGKTLAACVNQALKE